MSQKLSSAAVVIGALRVKSRQIKTEAKKRKIGKSCALCPANSLGHMEMGPLLEGMKHINC